MFNLSILSLWDFDFLDKSTAVNLICLDLSKAFDTVPRRKLLAKVEKMIFNTIIVQ